MREKMGGGGITCGEAESTGYGDNNPEMISQIFIVISLNLRKYKKSTGRKLNFSTKTWSEYTQ